MIDIKNVHVRYGALEALAGVSLTIAAGEVVGLVGPNGSGKSTLLDALGGLVPVASGTMAIATRPTRGLAPEAIARLGVGRCFQTPRLFDRLTVLANARAGQHSLPASSRAEAEPQALLERCGLGGALDRLAADVAGADRRRLELARTLAARPRVLLLDEPCAGLSGAEAEAWLGVLEWAARGRTVIIVEHRMPLLARLCSRLVALDRGVVVADGSPDSVRSHPALLTAYLGRRR